MSTRDQAATLLHRFRLFGQDSDGGITAFMLVCTLTIVVAAGMAIDFMRHETVRAELQYGIDRGVLAAASLSQDIDAETTVREYIRSAKYLDETVVLDVQATDNAGLRRVEATGTFTIGTYFLRLLGIPTLDVAARATAEEERTGVEISLVLDISGSMAWEGRIGNLIPAAQGFITQVMTPGTEETTTINFVPYAGGTNPGPTLAAALGMQRFHNRSSCPELTAADYSHTGLPSAGFYRQVPHFHWWPIAADQVAYMDQGWCPSDAVMPIGVMMNDSQALLDRIAGIRLHDGTGTHIAMKWALALLDPSSNDEVQTLIGAGEVDAAFEDRPAAWNDPETMKFIILMTDGQITDQHRPAPPYLVEVDPDPLPAGYDARTYNSNRTTNRDNFFAMCNFAKANGVTVFTIAFEVPAQYEYEMRDCASSPAHFYSVEGLEIADAFNSIAATISKLKLVN
jgi:hypothetical protein